MFDLVNGRCFVAIGVSLLVLILARGALADGAYQRTDDRKKTFVWNNDPQPGDAATWSGARDSEGYGEGRGTLTWFRSERKFQTGSNISGTKKVPISRYTGTMAHGKFEGPVVTVDHGKTYHATFADGQRKGPWSTGPAIAKAESAEAAPAEKREVSSGSSKVATAKKAEAPESGIREEPAAPSEGPAAAEGKREPAKTDARLAKTETSTEAISADELEESATPSKPVTKKAALAPGAVHAIEQPGRTSEKKAEKVKETTKKPKTAPKSEEPKTEAAEQQPESPAEGPRDLPTAAPSQPPPITVPSSDKPVDDSIRTLTGPPSSLHSKAPPAPSAAPELSMPSAPAPSAPSAAPKLNAVQAMDIADIEARTRGYDLGEFQLPKAEYNAASDTWSVSYTGRGGEKSGKRLSVIVQDKSGKAEVKK